MPPRTGAVNSFDRLLLPVKESLATVLKNGAPRRSRLAPVENRVETANVVERSRRMRPIRFRLVWRGDGPPVEAAHRADPVSAA
jgi:hypothetical protein